MWHHKKPVKAEAPNDKIYLACGDLDAKARVALDKMMYKQPFVSQLDILLSGDGAQTPALPEEIKTIMLGYTFQLARLNPAQLLESTFMNTYIRTGSLVAFSCEQPDGDIFAIDGAGRLALNLTKDTYEELGIVGNPSNYSSKRRRYCVSIDLRDACMRDGKPGYERHKVSLRRMGEIDVMLAFANAKGIAEHIVFPEGVKSKILQSSLSTHEIDIPSEVTSDIQQITQALTVKPGVNPKKRKRSTLDVQDLALDLLEKVGLAAMEESTFPSEMNSTSCTWEGFLHPMILRQVIQQINTSPSLTIATAHYFGNSPITSWLRRGDLKAKPKPANHDERDIDQTSLTGWTLMQTGMAAKEGTQHSRQYIFCEL